MSLKIVRNDITKMETEAIVNTANEKVTVGPGCDMAIYNSAGYDQLFNYRNDNIGEVTFGKAFITPGFELKAKYIIHVVSPIYIDGNSGEEHLLRECYRNALMLAKENNIKSISFPVVSTGSFGYPKEEGLRIALDEINAFLLNNAMQIYLVVFDEKTTELGKNIDPELESYIDRHYIEQKQSVFSNFLGFRSKESSSLVKASSPMRPQISNSIEESQIEDKKKTAAFKFKKSVEKPVVQAEYEALDEALCFDEAHESALEERMNHLSDTFQQYLFYLIESKGMTNAEVHKRAIVDKKVFSKIKNNVDYHPKKITALCLCIGAKLNLDETRDLLARAGYALSPCDKTDVIFSYFIENQVYDMLEIDIQLEEHGVPCIIQ